MYTVLADVDECFEAATAAVVVCEDVNSVCVNLEGSFRCDCVPGYLTTNGTCQRMCFHCTMIAAYNEYSIHILCIHVLIGIVNEPPPPPPPVIVPPTGAENSINFTATNLMPNSVRIILFLCHLHGMLYEYDGFIPNLYLLLYSSTQFSRICSEGSRLKFLMPSVQFRFATLFFLIERLKGIIMLAIIPIAHNECMIMMYIHTEWRV